MAIVVAPAAGPDGRAVVAALLEQGIEQVRAVVAEDADAPALRRLGAKVAVLDDDDDDGLHAVMRDAFTVVSLAADPWGPAGEAAPPEVRALAAITVACAQRAGAQRLALVSVTGADPQAADPWLAAAGDAESAVTGSGLDYVVLRCTHVLAPAGPLMELLTGWGRMARPPLVAPVWVGDLAGVLAAIDDAEVGDSRTVGLAGPDVVPLDRLAAFFGRGRSPANGRRAEGVRERLLAADSLLDVFPVPRPPEMVTPLAEALRLAGCG